MPKETQKDEKIMFNCTCGVELFEKDKVRDTKVDGRTVSKYRCPKCFEVT